MAVPDDYKLERRWSLTHFLIGVFGATAILGVMAKIFTFEAEVFGYLVTWKPMVLVGFMGEAFVFILMGMMRELQYVPVAEEEEPSREASAGSEGSTNGEALESELKSAEQQLTQEAKRLARKIQAVREELAEQIDVLEQLGVLRRTLREASDTLSNHSDVLGANMEDLQALYKTQTSMVQSIEDAQKELSEEFEGLGDDVEETREAMRALRSQFTKAARRLEQFNEPYPTDEEHSTNERTSAVPNSVS